MTLSDMLGRDIRLELHEAVAVMRAIADASATLAPSSAPELQDVELLGDGSVQLVGSALVEDPVRSLIEMLQALIGPAASAPQLESLMEQPYDSVAAFSRDLAYFERPNRSLILQDLYTRASGGVPVPAADELMASLRATPVPDATDQGEKQLQAESQHRRLLYVAALLGVVAVAALLFAFLMRGRAGPPGAPSTLTSKVAERVTSVAGAVGSAVKSIGERTGLAEAPPPVEATPPIDPVATRAASTQARGSSRSSISTSRGSPASTPLPGPGGTAVQGRITDRPLPVPATTPTEPAGDIGSNMVYAAGSADVVPPLGVRPHVPKELPPGIRPENVARIEIVVNPQGAVDTVKLVGPPRLNDAMLLSAAKAWRFRPAKRNGMPVTYRMTVSVAR